MFYKIKKTFFTYLGVFILILGSVFGCTKPIDLDQAKDLVITPVMETSLIFINQTPSDFLDANGNVVPLIDFIEVEFFSDEFIVENVVKADFVYEITNSIDRNFAIRIEFLNASGIIEHTTQIPVMASTNNLDVTSSITEEFQGNALLALKNTAEMRFYLVMVPNSPIAINAPGRIALKSKAVFYFDIDTNL